MDPLSIITLIVVIISFAVLFWLLTKKGKGTGDQSMVMLQNQINDISKTLDFRLAEHQKSFQAQSGQSQQIIKDVTERLTKLDETDEPVTLLETVTRARLPIAFLTDGMDTRRHLDRPTRDRFADLALRGRYQ